eukprot:TRINITY_DN2271_c0_g3_i1.p1 TRINITY_DN2271_c0_g3~~TRINITY_DN2271_c0_g3_i1.p1  ORF type:complete len:143 (-),score=7.64 TRINITY_DN2271_c0_g3_i1:338-766(-)
METRRHEDHSDRNSLFEKKCCSKRNKRGGSGRMMEIQQRKGAPLHVGQRNMRLPTAKARRQNDPEEEGQVGRSTKSLSPKGEERSPRMWTRDPEPPSKHHSYARKLDCSSVEAPSAKFEARMSHIESVEATIPLIQLGGGAP